MKKKHLLVCFELNNSLTIILSNNTVIFFILVTIANVLYTL